MRELTVEEMEQVDGGIGVFGAVTGAAAGVIGAAVTGAVGSRAVYEMSSRS